MQNELVLASGIPKLNCGISFCKIKIHCDNSPVSPGDTIGGVQWEKMLAQDFDAPVTPLLQAHRLVRLGGSSHRQEVKAMEKRAPPETDYMSVNKRIDLLSTSV